MIYELLKLDYNKIMIFVSIIATFIITILSIKLAQNILPHDGGRAYAINGQLSKGKPRGVGIVFVICFVIMSFIFIPLNREYIVYCILLLASMMSGFLDDRSDIPWGELKKGIIDLVIALMAVLTYINFNSNQIGIQLHNAFIEIPMILYVILATMLIWVSINVTNCSDGVDGLSGSLSVITLLTFYYIFMRQNSIYSHIVLLMVACVLGYLWYNVSPSKMLMGDAGSRALGFFIGVLALKTYNPLLYLLVAFMFIIDGGLGLVKVSLIRFMKIHILKNVRTPIHDYARKTLNWSDTQVVFKFTIIQLVISLIVFYCKL